MNKEWTEMQAVYEKKMPAYYDSEGRLLQYPSKRPMRVLAITKIADCGMVRNIGERRLA